MSALIAIRRTPLVPMIAACTLVMGCSGGDGADPIGPPGAAEPVFSALSLSISESTLFTRPPGNTAMLSAVPLDQAGRRMNGIGDPEFTSDNPVVASVDAAGMVTAGETGTTTLRASVTAQGVTRTAAVGVAVTNGDMEATVIAPAVAFIEDVVHIAAGGTVTWTFQGVAHTVVFTTPDAPADLPEPWLNGSRSRTFPDSGIFRYSCTVHAGMSGQVIVH